MPKQVIPGFNVTSCSAAGVFRKTVIKARYKISVCQRVRFCDNMVTRINYCLAHRSENLIPVRAERFAKK